MVPPLKRVGGMSKHSFLSLYSAQQHKADGKDDGIFGVPTITVLVYEAYV